MAKQTNEIFEALWNGFWFNYILFSTQEKEW